MKEKQNRLPRNSDGYLPFSLGESHHFNYIGKAANPLPLQTRQGNNYRNTRERDFCNFANGLSKDIKTVIRVSPTEDHHSAISKHVNGVKDTDMVKSDGKDEDFLNTPELECSIIMNDYAIHNKIEPEDTVGKTSELFQEDEKIYTDEGVLDYKPELIVCYKERNYNVVKAVCVDEGVPLEDKGLANLHFDKYSGPCAKEYASDEEPGDLDIELLIHDGVVVLSGADADVHNAKRSLSKEEGNGVSPFTRKSKCLAHLMNLDDQKDVSLQASEKDAGKKIESDVMVEESTVTRLLSMEKFGTRSFHRSVMKPSNNQEYEAQQPKQVVEHADTENGRQKSVSDNKYQDCPKNSSIVSKVLSSSLYGSSINIHQGTEPNYTEGYSANTFKVQRTGIDGNIVCEVQNVENIHQQPNAANNIVDVENPRQLQHKSWSSNCPANTDGPRAGVNEIGGKASFTIPGEACDGDDIVFDVSGQITYSGPITDSGSTSMRSESSTASTRSFAFPVLQPEWDSSPVKMGSPNMRCHSKQQLCLSKQQGKWKRGIFCCRF